MRSRPLLLLPFDVSGAEQLEWDGPTGEITAALPVGQVFDCGHDGLHRVEVFLEPTFHHKRCHLWAYLYVGDITGADASSPPRPIRVMGPVVAEKITAHGWLSFEFEPVPDSCGRTYSIVFVAPDASPGNALTLRISSRAGRGRIAGGYASPGALLFRAVCLKAGRAWENFRRAVQGWREPAAGIAHNPLMLQIEASRPCNLRCVMCHRGLTPYNGKRDGEAFMSLDTFRDLDSVLPDLLWIIGFGLGEPFLNHDYLAILRHTRALNPLVNVFTSSNGTCLTEKMLDEIVSERLISTLQVSLDGIEAKTFEAIRRHGSFATIMDCLRRVVAARERHGSSMRVRSSMLVMKPTIDQVFEYVRQMADLGVDLASLGTPRDNAFLALRSDSPDEMRRTYDQLVQAHDYIAGTRTQLDGPLLAEVTSWHRQSGLTDTPPRWGYDEVANLGLQPAVREVPCPVPWEMISISADGQARVCCNSYRLMARVKEATFDRTWQAGENYRQLRTEMLTGKLHGDCSGCLGGNTVTVDSITPAVYRGGAVTDQGATTTLADLIGKRPAEIKTVSTRAPGWTMRIEGDVSRGIRGWIRAMDGFVTDRPITLAIAIENRIEQIVSATIVSRHFATFTTAKARRPSQASSDLQAFMIQVQAGSVQLLPIISLPMLPHGAAELAPWLGGDEIIPSPSEKATLHGYIDEVRFETDAAWLIGWARDKQRRAPASRVVPVVAGAPFTAVRPWLNRPDVAKAFGDVEGLYGFVIALPMGSLNASSRRIEVLALDDHGSARELEWADVATRAMAAQKST